MITSGHDAAIGTGGAHQQRAALAGYPPQTEGHERLSASVPQHVKQHGAYTRGADGLLYPTSATRAQEHAGGTVAAMGGTPRPSTAPVARARQFRYV